MKLKSYAKVNLFLNVLSKRADNYHNLETIFERVSLCDDIILNRRRDNLIRVSCSDKSVPGNEGNICFKAAKLLQDKFFPSAGVDIRIKKLIPAGAGLGGGSGNAAAVLLGLNRLWRLKLPKTKLVKLAALLGSDVPFFIYGVPFASGTGRGEKIKPLSRLSNIRLWHVIAVPGPQVSTPLIYAEFDRLSELTKAPLNAKIMTSILAAKNKFLRPGFLFNSLEEAAFRRYPQVLKVKLALMDLGMQQVLMSGSGGAVFALVQSRLQALRLAKILRKKHKSWRVFVARTL